MTTIVYHMKNLLSVSSDKELIKYKNLNLILDEIEICFHPEYQRTFINNLIKTIERLRLNQEYKINIILSTHSPFILSDIPKSNILLLKKGVGIHAEKKENFPNTFGANISDLLKNNFFLDKGFIGEFASCTIQHVIGKIGYIEKTNNEIQYTHKDLYDECKKIINLIGEPLIKHKLFDMLERAFYKNNEISFLKVQKQRLKEELAFLEEKIQKIKNKG